MKYLAQILETKQTAFKTNELALILNIKNKHTLKNILQRMKRSGILIYHRGGIRTLKNYNTYELASKIKSKSYISLETVLQKEGVTFQHYEKTIMAVSDRSFEKTIDKITYSFSKIKDEILLNPIGIKSIESYPIATKERAVCDRIYFTPSYYFDNLSNLNLPLLEKLSTIYNKRTNLCISQLINDLKQKNEY